MGLSPDPHRRRMPWTAEKECVPGVVHSSKEKMVLDGAQRVGVECVDRVHRRCIRWRHCGRPSPNASTIHLEERTFLIVLSGGIQCTWAMLYREEWPEGTHDENATRTAIHFRRCKTTTQPAPIRLADFPRWHALFCLSPLFSHPERRFRSPCRCKFLSLADTHPLIDAAGTAAHCWCFWHDCCTAPSIWCSGTGDENTAEQFHSDGAGSPVSVSPTPAASREIDGAGEESNDCRGNNCFLTSLPVKQPEELTTTSVTNNDKGTATTADSDSSTAVFYTTSHPLRLIVTYATDAAVASGPA
ncbi:hypothetical protein TcYC6_0008230 [Trypanosoma cruzi]|nr:hypothetical protein TcYC6_0008230 [Trypanosoma cruzi]